MSEKTELLSSIRDEMHAIREEAEQKKVSFSIWMKTEENMGSWINGEKVGQCKISWHHLDEI